jgi:Cohesin domain
MEIPRGESIMKTLLGLTTALLLGGLGQNVSAQAPPTAAAKKEVVWVCKGPIAKATGMAKESGDSMTIKKTEEKVDYENTISWTAPPLVLHEGDEVTVKLQCTTGKSAEELDYARVEGGFAFIGCIDNKDRPKDTRVKSTKTGREGDFVITYPQSLTLKFTFKPTIEKPQIRLDAHHNDKYTGGLSSSDYPPLGDVVKTWEYERQERDATAAPPATATGRKVRIRRITGNVQVGSSYPEPGDDAKEGMELTDNMFIDVGPGPDSEAVLELPDGSIATLRGFIHDMHFADGHIESFPSSTITEIHDVRNDATMELNRAALRLRQGIIQIMDLEQSDQLRKAAREMRRHDIETNTTHTAPGGTSYTVRHDTSKKGETIVSVQEGKVTVTPKNATLKPVSLNACQQVKVSDTAISAVESTGPQVMADGTGCCSSPCPDPHATKLTLQAPELLASKGQEVLVPVYLIKPTDVANINWTLTYDPKVVTPNADVPKGNLLDKASYFANTKESGVIYGTFMDTAGLKGTATGTVATVKFQVLGETGSQTPFQLAVTTINNPAGTKLPIDLLHGSLHVVGKGGRPPGTGPSTPPGSGGPLALDALSALKMSVKLIPVDMNYDVDHVDGVTSRDAVIIAQRRLAELAKKQT